MHVVTLSILSLLLGVTSCKSNDDTDNAAQPVAAESSNSKKKIEVRINGRKSASVSEDDLVGQPVSKLSQYFPSDKWVSIAMGRGDKQVFQVSYPAVAQNQPHFMRHQDKIAIGLGRDASRARWADFDWIDLRDIDIVVATEKTPLAPLVVVASGKETQLDASKLQTIVAAIGKKNPQGKTTLSLAQFLARTAPRAKTATLVDEQGTHTITDFDTCELRLNRRGFLKWRQRQKDGTKKNGGKIKRVVTTP